MEDDLTILIADDDDLLRSQLSRSFSKRGYKVDSAANTSEALNLIDKKVFKYAIVDLRMAPGPNGLEVIGALKQKQPNTKSIVFTGFGTINSAVEAVKRGATHYLTKPATIDEIISAFDGKQNQPIKMPSLDEVTDQYVNQVLTEFDGNVSKSAKILGLHRRSLQRKLTKKM
jgi:two-component system response regulator RegA